MKKTTSLDCSFGIIQGNAPVAPCSALKKAKMLIYNDNNLMPSRKTPFSARPTHPCPDHGK